MLTVLWGTVKKYGDIRGRVAYRLKEQKRSQYKQSTLRIKDFKYGPSLSLLTEKHIRRQTVKRPLIFHHDNNTTAEFDSGPQIPYMRGNRGPK